VNPPRPESEAAGRLLRALVVGLLGGSTAIALRYLVTEAPRLVWAAPHMVSGVAQAPPLERVLVPAVGGLLAGLVLALGVRWAGSARGWDILEAVVLRSGVLPLRSAIVRATSSVLTQASAGAVGREGPIVLVAAATASRVAGHLRVPTRERRLLVACGAAAGLACAYNTPLGAALFAMEILLGTFSLEAFAPLALSSAAATLLTWAAFGHDPVFRVPPAALASPWEIALCVVLGVLGGGVAALFLEALRASASLYRWMRLPRPVGMATAGLVLGLVTLRFPEIVGNGRDAIAALFARPWGIEHVLALLALRLVVTPLAVGSGTVGGVFTPTLFLGAMLGHAFGVTVATAAPGLGTDPAAFALAGMGALLAGTTHAPLTAVVMVFEMSLDYDVVVPLLLGSAAASVVATRFTTESVYTEALRRKGSQEEGPGALDVLRVADVVRPDGVTVAPDLPLARVLDTFVAARRNHLYVVDADGAFLGAVNLHDVNDALRPGPHAHAVRGHRARGGAAARARSVRGRGVRAAAGPRRPRLAPAAGDDLEAGHPVGVLARAAPEERRALALPPGRGAGRGARRRGPAPARARRPRVRRVALPRVLRPRAPVRAPQRGHAPARRGAPFRGRRPPGGVRPPRQDRRPQEAGYQLTATRVPALRATTRGAARARGGLPVRDEGHRSPGAERLRSRRRSASRRRDAGCR
jgi:CIC family chloride channel protein